MRLRSMTADDAAEVSWLYVRSWQAGYRGLLPQEFLESLRQDRWLHSFAGQAGSFVLTDGGVIVGHLNARPAADPKMARWGELHTLYVLPEYWGRGCGGLLLERGVEWLRGQGLSPVYLWALETNTRARGFYEKHGFAPTADRLLCEIGGVQVTDIRYTR